MLHLLAAEGHDRHDIGQSDAWVDAIVRAEIEVLDRHCDSADERLDQTVLVSGDGVDGPVVVEVGVYVEEVCVLGKRRPDRSDDFRVTPLGEVRHGFEERHGSTLRSDHRDLRAARVTHISAPSHSSISTLQRDLRLCRRCADAGFPIESTPVVHGSADRRAYLYGQAPGIVEGTEGAPWRGRAGRTLRSWLELDEEAFYDTFYCASITRCYPGRVGARGDRTPTLAEQRLCSSWRDEELRLLRPVLVITVGALAARAIIGAATLGDCIGKSFLVDGAVTIPLPHPSGASSWLNDSSNRARLGKALTHTRREISRLRETRERG